MNWEPPYDWGGLHRHYKWATISPNRKITYWSARPTLGEDDWKHSYMGFHSIPEHQHNMRIPALYDWQDSLRSKPEEEFYV